MRDAYRNNKKGQKDGRISRPLLTCNFVTVIYKTKAKSWFHSSFPPIIIIEDFIYRLFFIVSICSLREIERLCRNDIRYMYFLDEMKAPTFATFGNLIRNELTDSIEQIFMDINAYIFSKNHVDFGPMSRKSTN